MSSETAVKSFARETAEDLVAAAVEATDPSAGMLDHRRLVESLGAVLGGIADGGDQDTLLRLIVEKMCKLVGAGRGSAYLRDTNSGLFHGQVAYGYKEIDPTIKRLVCGIPADGFTAEIIETRAPVVIANLRSDPRPVRSAIRAWHAISAMGVPMLADGQVVGIIFLDTEGEARDFNAGDRVLASVFADLAAIAVAQSRLYRELKHSHDTVTRQNKILRRVNAVDDRLTMLVLEGRNLHEIAEAVTELTVKPAAIFDAADRCLAAFAPPEVAEPVPSIFEPEVRATRQVAEALAALPPSEPTVVGPFPAAGIPHRLLLAPVIVRDEQWGTLVLSEHGARFNGFDVLVSKRTATLVALEMSAGRREAGATWDARASLVSELIRGGGEEGQLEGRANFLEVPLGVPRVVCLLAGRRTAEGLELPEPSTAAAALHRRLGGEHGIIGAETGDGVALLVDLPECERSAVGVMAVREAVAGLCAELDTDGNLIAGISALCERPVDYSRAYGEAAQVVRALDAFSSGSDLTTLSADDLGRGRVFLAACDPREAEAFVGQTFGALLEESKARVLLETLACVFEQNGHVRHAAEVMELHENTLRYRLGRIEQLTGRAVITDSDAQLDAQLGLMVLRLQGRLRPPAHRAVLVDE
ncbi:MAG: GAF domain-containing protein [Actinobacteria bacterium]|nr:GAF domain-containing protein [Actinomycetota bacterium]